MRLISTRVWLVLAFIVVGAMPWAQVPTDGLTLVSPRGREPLSTIEHEGETMLSLDELARVFRFDVREESRGGTISISTDRAVIILTPDQQVVSVDGRLVSLRTPPRRVGNQWAVPLDFLNRALARASSEPVEFRPRAGLLLVGDVEIPEVSASYQLRGDAGVLTLDITPSTAHRVDQRDGRLVVELEADGVEVTRPPRLRGTLVTRLDHSQAPPQLGIELGPDFESYRSASEATPDGGTRITIELIGARTAATVPPPEPDTPAVNPPPPAAATDPLPVFTTASTVRVVAIDAGHGGDEIGSEGSGGALEKDVTLSVTRRLRNVIENRLGLRVILTRSRDETVDLDARAAIANNNKADLFISLHANASARPSATGAEVFYLSLDEYGAEARALAEREAAPIPVVGGGSRQIDLVLWEMAQVRYVDRSARLAEIVDQELERRVPMSPRPVQQAPFRVLVGANMPAVLVELGSLFDPAEERRLTSAAYQNAVVEALVASILRFRDYIERVGEATAPIPETSDAGSASGQVRQ